MFVSHETSYGRAGNRAAQLSLLPVHFFRRMAIFFCRQQEAKRHDEHYDSCTLVFWREKRIRLNSSRLGVSIKKKLKKTHLIEQAVKHQYLPPVGDVHQTRLCVARASRDVTSGKGHDVQGRPRGESDASIPLRIEQEGPTRCTWRTFVRLGKRPPNSGMVV